MVKLCVSLNLLGGEDEAERKMDILERQQSETCPKSTMKFLQEKKIKVFQLPSLLLDMNITKKNLWEETRMS